MFNEPEWDYLKYDFANYRRDSKLAGSMLNATDTNLDAFKARGGKLVLYHGWSDAALSANATTKYYEQVQARDRGRDFARLFMMPGVAHCQGGPGPDRVDWYSVIDNWVEKGAAPERIVATKMASGQGHAQPSAVRVSVARGLQGHWLHRRRSQFHLLKVVSSRRVFRPAFLFRLQIARCHGPVHQPASVRLALVDAQELSTRRDLSTA